MFYTLNLFEIPVSMDISKQLFTATGTLKSEGGTIPWEECGPTLRTEWSWLLRLAGARHGQRLERWFH